MVFPAAGGFRRLRHPGSIVHALRAERWVPPTERAGSEGSIICRLRRQRCLWQRKPTQPGWRPLEMHPFCRLRRRLLHGKASHTILSRLRLPTNPVTCFPLGERWCAAPKGVNFHAPQARLFGFAAKRLINFIARRAIPQPFEPSEPFEPSRPKGVSRRPHIPTVSSRGSWQKSFMAPSAIFPPSWAEPSTT